MGNPFRTKAAAVLLRAVGHPHQLFGHRATELTALLVLLSPGLLLAQSVPAQSPSGSASRSTPPGALAVNPFTGLTSASATNYKPLTGRQRLYLYWKQNYWSVGAYFGPVLSALVLDQATGSPMQWGGGFEGYGRRLASRIGVSVIQGNVQAGLAVPLHEDVRYIALGQGSFGRRALHAVVYTFLTYNNGGRPTLNIANISGYYAATAVSTVWVPTNESTGHYTLVNGTEQFVLSVPVNIFQEFWPDIKTKVFHVH